MDLASQAFGCNNFELATEIFDHLLQTHGPNMDWLLGRGDAYARRGYMNEALGDYVHAFRLGEVQPERLRELVNSLVASVSSKSGLLSSLHKYRSKLKEQPVDMFMCLMCQGLLHEPTTLPCGHTFCKECLLNSTESRACTKCKDKQAKTDSLQMPKPNVVLGGLIEKYFPEETKARQLRLQGNKLYAKGKLEEAVAKYTEATKLEPHDYYALSNRAHVYTALEQYEKALVDAQDVTDIKPDWAKGYYRKGMALTGLHRQEEATVAYLQSLALDPHASASRKCLEKALHDLLSPVQTVSLKRLELQSSFTRPLRTGSPTSPVTLSRGISDLAEEVVLGLQAVNQLITEEDSEEKDQTETLGSDTPKPETTPIPEDTPKSGITAEQESGGTSRPEATSESESTTQSETKCSEAKPTVEATPTLRSATPPRELEVRDKSQCQKDMSMSDIISLRKRKRCMSSSDTILSPTRKMEFKFARVDLLKKARVVPEEKIDKEDYECSLCFRLFLEPLTTPCGHTFCKVCLNRSLDYNNCCPLCKHTLAEYLAARRNNVTELTLFLLREYLGEEYREREELHKKQMEAMASAIPDADQTECEVPIFICTLAFPTIPCPLHIFEPRYRLMVRQAMDSGSRQFGMCLPDPNQPEQHLDIGCMLEIQHVQNLPDGRSVIKTIGGRRFKVLSTGMRDGYNTALVQFIKDNEVTGEDVNVVGALEAEVHQQAQTWFQSLPIFHQTRILSHFGPTPAREEDPLSCPQGPSWTWWLLAILPLNQRIQMTILALPSLKERLVALQRCLAQISNFQF